MFRIVTGVSCAVLLAGTLFALPSPTSGWCDRRRRSGRGSRVEACGKHVDGGCRCEQHPTAAPNHSHPSFPVGGLSESRPVDSVPEPMVLVAERPR